MDGQHLALSLYYLIYGLSVKCVHSPEHVAGNPLSLWERARVRESLSSALNPSAGSYKLAGEAMSFLRFWIRELRYDFPHRVRTG